uniref:Ig-like domain-containing protein n=1 Tax=Cynoglossus semilaevis TaxID=244447 RepID=A0A3P8UWK2_CYNSE
MVLWTLVYAVLIAHHVTGRPSWLPPPPALPMRGDCYVAEPEVELFRVEGEAVILSFPLFRSTLTARDIAPPAAVYLITKDNGTEGAAYPSSGRVLQRNRELWLLPAQASDSGEYICTYRNESYCIRGSITLQVYESSSVGVDKLSYPISATVGETLSFRCPSVSHFNSTDEVIHWYKNSTSGGGSFGRHRGNLMIPGVKRSDAGVYTCQLTVLINDRLYKVSRVILLQVEDPELTTMSDPSVTSDPELIDTTPIFKPPVIISPLNGTLFQSAPGSGVVLYCDVLTECEMADSTMVTWLIKGQPVELSYLDERALQGGRSVTKVPGLCQVQLRLLIVRVTGEDRGTEVKCVAQNQGGRQEVAAQLQLEDSSSTWVVVAAVAVSCFVVVASIVLYVLLKPKRNNRKDYILARQSSTF